MKYLVLYIGLFLLYIVPIHGQAGLLAEYYNGQNFETYVGRDTVANLSHYWNDYGPLEGLDPHLCSVRYTGILRTPRSGDIAFSAMVDDGIRVWIGDKLLINNWQLNDVGFSNGKLYLEAGVEYTIKVEYFNALKEAELHLYWKLPEDPDQGWFSSWWDGDNPKVVPAEYFSLPQESIPAVKLNTAIEPTPTLEVESPMLPMTEEKEPEQIAIEPTIRKPIPSTKEDIKQYIPSHVEFELGKADILTTSYPELNTLATFLSTNPTRKVDIAGHTDYVGDAAKNLELSERRARAVAAYLIKQGVSHTQINSAKGYGGSQPINKSTDSKHHPENRRVEFIIQ